MNPESLYKFVVLNHLTEFFKEAILARRKHKKAHVSSGVPFNNESLKSNDNLFKGVPLEHVESDAVLKLKK